MSFGKINIWFVDLWWPSSCECVECAALTACIPMEGFSLNFDPEISSEHGSSQHKYVGTRNGRGRQACALNGGVASCLQISEPQAMHTLMVGDQHATTFTGKASDAHSL